MSQTLCFNDVLFDVIPQNSQPWVRSPQIAEALGYGQANRINDLYTRHADEFTDAMTAVVSLPTEGGPQETRIFSLRGCHLLAMFARTPVAKEFRRWVLDVLDRLAEEERARQLLTNTQQLTADAPITPDQQCTLQAMVKARVESIPADARPKGLFPQIWSRFNNHFRIARYCQLPQSRMSEAIAYLTKMEIVQQALENPKPKALPAGYPPLAEAGASCMAEILNLRGSLFKASVDLKAVMQMGLSHGNGQNLGEVQRAFSASLGQSVDAFFMSINHNMIAIEHMFRAFMEAEKLIHG